MKVLILNKREFDNMMQYMAIDDSNAESQDLMLISVCSPPDDDQPGIASLSRNSYFKSDHENVKTLFFGDYGENMVGRTEHMFTDEQAEELYNFIKVNKDKHIAIVHCGAGISRSGAIGTFIHDLYGTIPYEEFKRKNPRIMPNSYVLRLLRYQQNKDTK